MKRKICLALMTMVCAVVSAAVPAAAGSAEREGALFIESAGIRRASTGDEVLVRFKKTVASAEVDLLAAQGEKVFLNGTSVAALAKSGKAASMRFASMDGIYQLVIETADGFLAGDGTDRLTVDKGFRSANGDVTTVKLMYALGRTGGSGTRIYRGTNLDDYETATPVSVSAPSVEDNNLTFAAVMDRAITDRKYINLQYRAKDHFNALANPEFPYSAAELDLFYNFGLITADKETSILYTVELGFESLSGTSDAEGEPIEPRDTVEGIDLYNVDQLQSKFEGSDEQPVVVQIHFESNMLKIYLKGDSSTGANLRPEDANQKFVLRLKAGLMFANGSMIKEDVTFLYDPTAKTWRNLAGQDEVLSEPDDTLDNQGGYTAEERR